MATRKNKRRATQPPTPWAPKWADEALDAEAELAASIRNLRHVFARYRGEKYWADPLDDKPFSFTDRPAHLSCWALTEDEVSYFYSHAVCKAFEPDRHIVAATKYFLPRVFDVAVRICHPGDPITFGLAFDWWFIVQNMNRSRWLKWPEQERQAVLEFFQAWWAATIGYHLRLDGNAGQYGQIPLERSADVFFRAASGLGIDLHAMLAQWRATRTASAAAQLIGLISRGMDRLLTTGYLWDDSYTDAVMETQGQIVRWLLEPETAQQLREAGDSRADKDAVSLVDGSIEQLGWILPTWRSLADRSSFPQWVRDLAV